ncbi:MAG TPA: 2-succinyl-5-enolpyruvyl-6-hydroxy-3-cyclohexene-1-carboxylic-acid synthase [Actinotalea sp.]|jgi:2-succinyl-5-enolpyruvyl-6-hydroxy-3-cyclohexene-1-carboxylate synthase
MSRPAEAPPSTQAARVLLQALAALGVGVVVLAPGSRSAPLAHAVAQAARRDAGRDANAPVLDLHVRIDERSAGFLALGFSRGARSGGGDGLVAVVTTSGTAVANLHPAVLEAHHSGLPLLLLTADRPHELRGTGANQTTDQVGLLHPVRLTLDVPASTGRPGEARDLRHLASRAVAAALGSRTGDPGPVHVNLAFREPLVPDGAPWPEASREGLVEVVPARPVGERAELGGDAVPTVVVAGDGAGPLARAIAEANGWPLLAEPSSGARGGPCAVPAYRLLLGEDRLGGAVRRVVVLGRPTLSRPVQTLLGRPDVDSTVIALHGQAWPDATRSATRVLPGVPGDLLDGSQAGPAGWLTDWQVAGAAALAAVRAVAGAGSARLTGPAVADVVAASCGPDAVLVVGSSNPVRDLDLVAEWSRPPAVLANRGLAGIDGTISTAAGVALALDRPVVALLGDLTFLHEAGGLLVGPHERRPDLHVVVANDDGGSIFATLEHGGPEHEEVFERVFGTPHGADVGALCRGYGVPHALVEDAAGLRAALARVPSGLTVTEVRVDRHDRRGLGTRIAAAVHEAVAAALEG